VIADLALATKSSAKRSRVHPRKHWDQMQQLCAKCAKTVPISRKPLRPADLLLASRYGCLCH
jgi:hypothetical protein